MHTNKFSIRWLTGAHISSIANEFIRTILSLFYEKILNAQKRKSNQNQLTKQKQVNKKQQTQQFLCTKTSKKEKIVYLAFLKKKWNFPDNRIYYTIFKLVEKNKFKRSTEKFKDKLSSDIKDEDQLLSNNTRKVHATSPQFYIQGL